MEEITVVIMQGDPSENMATVSPQSDAEEEEKPVVEFVPDCHNYAAGSNVEMSATEEQISTFVPTSTVTSDPLASTSDISDMSDSTPTAVTPQQPLPVAEMMVEYDSVQLDQGPVAYEKLPFGSARANPKVVDSRGFSYVVKKKSTSGVVYWRCSKRTKYLRCGATIKECDGEFVPGAKKHTHPPDDATLVKARVKSAVRYEATRQDLLQKPSSVVNQVLLREVKYHDPKVVLPMRQTLVKMVRRTKAKRIFVQRNLNLNVIDPDAVSESFCLADVTVKECRHMVFATEDQLSRLSKAKCWYMDVMTDILPDPFTQLWSIGSFTKKDEEIKQVPLVFMLMSDSGKKAFKKVMKLILNALPKTPKVKYIVADFNITLWKILPKVFLEIFNTSPTMKGCAFHWAMKVWEKAMELELEQSFHTQPKVHYFIKQILALPFLPADHIPHIFEVVRKDVEDKSLLDFCEYIKDTWMQDGRWSPEVWSVCQNSVRTAEDVEEWCDQLQPLVEADSSTVPQDILVAFLYFKAIQVTPDMKMLSEKKLKSYQQNVEFTQFKTQKKIFLLWDTFLKGKKSAMQLLKYCSTLFEPMKL